MGLNPAEIVRLAEASFHHAFLPDAEKAELLAQFRSGTSALGLL
jgi:adenosine deaminase